MGVHQQAAAGGVVVVRLAARRLCVLALAAAAAVGAAPRAAHGDEGVAQVAEGSGAGAAARRAADVRGKAARCQGRRQLRHAAGPAVVAQAVLQGAQLHGSCKLQEQAGRAGEVGGVRGSVQGRG